MKAIWIGSLVLALLITRGRIVLRGEELTETDKLRVQVVALMQRLAATLKEADECRAQLAEPRAQMNQQQIDAALKDAKTAIEKAHPGYRWDPQSGALTKTPSTAP